LKVFTVNKELGIHISTTTFALHEGDVIWVEDYGLQVIYPQASISSLCIVKAEYQFKKFNGRPPGRSIIHVDPNRNKSAWCHKTLKSKTVKDLIREDYIRDITITHQRNLRIEKLLSDSVI